MKITQIRNATQVIEYAGKTFLIDPFLAPKGMYPGFEGTANSHLRNPLVELSLPIEVIVEQTGFSSILTFRNKFKERFSVTPNQWRKTFQHSGTDHPCV